MWDTVGSAGRHNTIDNYRFPDGLGTLAIFLLALIDARLRNAQEVEPCEAIYGDNRKGKSLA